ncbi:uncharacterized protein [Amphiura filiformis]|uniref:uncharacterized protein n=1 Tax=Amphiura filiformis TaxID=82378 RepID=UPI003B2250B0
MMSLSKIKRSDLRFGEELGRGGFSTVYKAKWKRYTFKSPQHVAAKKLCRVEVNEVEIMSKLDHENIVKLIGVVDEPPDFSYLILELCSGGSLRAYLDKQNGKRLPDDLFYRWSKEAGRPIDYLQKMGILHKDIKADNYVIAAENTLKLTDFGLARELNATQRNATGRGTYGFMAPELMKDLELSPSYDIFSYGVVIWELWTTEVPFKGVDVHCIIWRVCRYNEHPPIPADCPPAIAALMRQCWEVNRARRPQMDHILKVITNAEADAIRKSTKQRQLLHGPWVLEQKIVEDTDGSGKLIGPCGIAVNPKSGDIAVADNAGRVMVYSADGCRKFDLDTKRGLKPETSTLPSYITASLDGVYFLTDETQYVKFYSKNGFYRGKWAAISPQGKASDTENTNLCSLGIGGKDQLFVGEIKQQYVSKHTKDGCHVGSFQVAITPYCLAVSSQGTIILSDWSSKTQAVHIVDNSGNLLQVIKPPSEIKTLMPLCSLTWFDDIICTCTYYNKRICCFSLSGEYLGTIPVKIPNDPNSLMFTADGRRLMVSYGDAEQYPPSGIAVYKLRLTQ